MKLAPALHLAHCTADLEGQSLQIPSSHGMLLEECQGSPSEAPPPRWPDLYQLMWSPKLSTTCEPDLGLCGLLDRIPELGYVSIPCSC